VTDKNLVDYVNEHLGMNIFEGCRFRFAMHAHRLLLVLYFLMFIKTGFTNYLRALTALLRIDGDLEANEAPDDVRDLFVVKLLLCARDWAGYAFM
jgi:hypothetical protein